MQFLVSCIRTVSGAIVLEPCPNVPSSPAAAILLASASVYSETLQWFCRWHIASDGHLEATSPSGTWLFICTTELRHIQRTTRSSSSAGSIAAIFYLLPLLYLLSLHSGMVINKMPYEVLQVSLRKPISRRQRRQTYLIRVLGSIHIVHGLPIPLLTAFRCMCIKYCSHRLLVFVTALRLQ